MPKHTTKSVSQKIVKSLETNKLLMLQDKEFPNVIKMITGEAIAGSWWGHPMANTIYNGLNLAIEKESILAVKLIANKVTYIHSSLQPFLMAIVSQFRPWQLSKISPRSLEFLVALQSYKAGIRSDDKKLQAEYPDLKKIIVDLEKRLLVFTQEIHTESGKHVKIIKLWKDAHVHNGKLPEYEDAIEKFNLLFKTLSPSSKKHKYPWPSSLNN